MVETAVIVARGEEGVPPLTQVGGLSLLKRAVLTAQKAGAITCYVLVDPHREAALRAELAHDPRVTAKIIWVRTDTAVGVTGVGEAGGQAVSVVFTANTVFRPPLLLELAGRVARGGAIVAVTTDGIPAIMAVPRALTATVLASVARGDSWQETLTLLPRGSVQSVEISGHLCSRVADPHAVARAERALLCSLENARDGIVDTYFNRKLSRPLSRWLLRTPLSPNQITLLSCGVGLLGALCFVPGGYWGPLVGALLLQGAAVLDCCDGEIARIKFLESPLGGWLDIVCDTVVHLAVFAGIGVAVWRGDLSSHALLLAGGLALGGLLAFPLVTLAEKTETWGERRGGWEDVWIKKLLAALTTRDFSVLIIASAALGKLKWFLWGAAIGAHVFWLSLAWLLFRARRFVWLRHAWGRRG